MKTVKQNDTRFFLGFFLLFENLALLAGRLLGTYTSDEVLMALELMNIIFAIFILIFHKFKAASILLIVDMAFYLLVYYLDAISILSTISYGKTVLASYYHACDIFALFLPITNIILLILGIASLKKDSCRIVMAVCFLAEGIACLVQTIGNDLISRNLAESYLGKSSDDGTTAIIIIEALLAIVIAIIILAERNKETPTGALFICIAVTVVSVIACIVSAIVLLVNGGLITSVLIDTIHQLILPVLGIFFLKAGRE